jgi:hypothetical protein
MATTKKDVRSNFKYVRFLMQEADKVMKQGADDYSESSAAGQLALELTASAATFGQWLEEQQAKAGK